MFKEMLKKLRKARGLDQSQLGEILNVSQSTIASWENGTRRPDLEMFRRIVDYFGVSADTFLGTGIEDNDKQEVWRMLEAARRDENRKVLFKFSRDGTPSQVRTMVSILDSMRATNPDFYDGDDPA